MLHQGAGPDGETYRYVLVKEGTDEIVDQESFDRPGGENTPMNEFYGRSWTRKYGVRTFEPIVPAKYDRVPSNLHPQDQIPTLHIIGNQDDIDTLHKNYLQDIDTHVNVTYISADQVLSFSDAKFKLGGRASRLQTKASYNLNLAKHTKLEGFRKLKIRAMADDPSYIREKLAMDMLQAAGVPASQSSYIRLFINRQAIGLFLLEEKYDDSWLQAEFNGGRTPYDNGMLYRGEGAKKDGRRADLSYHGDDSQYYAGASYAIKEERDGVNSTDAGFKDLVSFIQFLDTELRKDPKTVSLEEWNEHIDMDSFFTSMAFEFLHSFCNGYLQSTNNWYMYENDSTSTPPHMVWMSWDLDSVLGSGYVKYKETITGDYVNFPGMQLRPFTKLAVTAPALRERFGVIIQMINSGIYDPKISFPVIDSLVDLIEEDVAWDKSLPRIRSGINLIPYLGAPNFVGNLFNHNATDDSMSLPLSFELVRAVDYFLRVNRPHSVDFREAVEGPTHHSSLTEKDETVFYSTGNVHASMPSPYFLSEMDGRRAVG
ncbi:coth protein-domain-containing protein [Syncephalastrum racemosum]|uniref:Coth protein-domain-containing protein n=1 Tax=Syncephalastrum racemosum TaxID=13706 RepID=A0A1X2HGU9_SYNRA|nr:coth protein-domain-containing protein [Syncephalastrum racemosum]